MSLQPIGFTPAVESNLPKKGKKTKKTSSRKNRGLAFYLTNIYAEFSTEELLERFEERKNEYKKYTQDPICKNEIFEMQKYRVLETLRVLRKELKSRDEFVEIFD